MKITKISKRVMASLIDLIFVLIMSCLIIYIVNDNYPYVDFNLSIQNSLYKSRGMLIGLMIDLIYTVYFIQSDLQSTLGMKIMRIKIIKENGNTVNFGSSLLRYFVSLFSSIILKIGYMYALMNDKNQTLHDYICRTYVIEEDNEINVNEKFLNVKNLVEFELWNSLNGIGKIGVIGIVLILFAMALGWK